MQDHRYRFLPLAVLVALSALRPPVALGADELNVTTGKTKAGAPLAMHGFDPVAVFKTSTPQEGDAQFATVYEGATYYFVSQENLDTFKTEPTKYAPQFGGFCTFGVAKSTKFDGDPRYWTINDGKLYLNLNATVQNEFKKDVSGNIARASGNWPAIQHKAAKDL